MLKAGCRDRDGRPVILLGITGENVARLVAGEPILVRHADIASLFPDGLGADVAIVVCYGKTDDAVRAEVQRHLPVRLRQPPPV